MGWVSPHGARWLAKPNSLLPLFSSAQLSSTNDYIADLAPLVLYTGGDRDLGSTSEVGMGQDRKAAHKAKLAAKSVEASSEPESPSAPDLSVASAEASSAPSEPSGPSEPSLIVGAVPGENGSLAAEALAAGNSAQQSFSDPRSEEQHFLTRLIDGKLVTEVAVQIGSGWKSRREMDLENASAASVTARELLENAHRAENEKKSGNQAFENAEYAQAAVHYTVAIDLAASADSLSTLFPKPVNPLLHACYSNRAACFLKLGHHEKALADANSCIAIAPEAFVKGHFRRGLALHALGRLVPQKFARCRLLQFSVSRYL
jgi:hypothetical protein